MNRIAEDRKNAILENSDDEKLVRRQSAELNGLLGYYRKGNFDDIKKDVHFLIHSDTLHGEAAAGIIKEWAEKYGCKNVEIRRVEDLRTDDLSYFRSGINNLVSWCGEELAGYKENKYEIIFNLVGGYKVLQGYMQTLGMFYADESVYMFEGSDELLSIPSMPVDFKENAKSKMAENISLIRRLRDRDVPCPECDMSLGVMVEVMGGTCTLSAWGKLMFNMLQDELYSRNPLPSYSTILKYGDKTNKAVSEFDTMKTVEFNKKIDDLIGYLESDFTKNTKSLRSLDFKKLKGNLKSPSTHEIDLWADKDVWRGYLHEENGVWILDSVGPALH